LLALLLFLLGLDVFLHKGQTRVLIGKKFNTTPYSNLNKQPLLIAEKVFVKAVNTVERFKNVALNASSVEIDMWYDSSTDKLKICHHLAQYSGLNADVFIPLICANSKVKNSLVIYCDIKNLDSTCNKNVLHILNDLRAKNNLQNKMIVECGNPAALDIFFDAGFFTVFYTPVSNPFSNTVSKTNTYLQKVKYAVVNHKICGLSGYYFQIPALQQAFPSMPVFQWQEFYKYSLVGQLYKKKILSDSLIFGAINY
jgi:hypothetical protein